MTNSDCEECKVNPWKYKCPGCSIRSCGLSCVKAHKKRTGCTGKRKATDFVPLTKFDDNILLSDYRLLEETKRVAESAQRRLLELGNYQYKLPYMLRSLQNAARSRGTHVLFLPKGMLKTEKNQSSYNIESKCISWTIEWRFHSTDVVLTDHGVGEDTKLCSVMEKHLKPGPWLHKLKPFCDVDLNSLRLFIRQRQKNSKVVFKELDIKAPLRHQFNKVTVLEYPVIHVYLPSDSYDFEFYTPFNHRKTTPDTNGSLYDGQGSANGIPFREEVLEEDEDDSNSFEPKVLDLYQQMNYKRQRVSESSKTEGGVTENSHPQVGPTEQEDAVTMELEIEPELMDSYSDLFAEMDPGEFDFESEFDKGLDSDINFNLQDLATDFDTDGLEEGEIAEEGETVE